MRRGGRALLSLSYILHSPVKKHYPLAKSPSPTSGFQGSTSFSISSSSHITPSVQQEEENTSSSSSKSQRDSLILEQFRQKKLKGSSKDSKGKPQVSTSPSSSSDTTTEKVVQKGSQNENEADMVVASFNELGMSEELVEVMEGIGDFVPSEIQCVVIPSILEGKSVLLSSPSQPDRTLAYLLPLIQLLRRDGELLGSNSKHPRAIVLCATEEKAGQCFNAAKYIIHNAELKSAKDCASPDNEHSNASIGLMIGTPCEILQYIEEGSVVPAELRYLVLDEADFMLGNGLGPEINEIFRPLQDQESKPTIKKLQTILAISTIAEVLGEQSPFVKHLERDHAGNISAMSLEMEQTEVFHFIESLDALRKKVAEAMDSLLK
ncbi:DEAD-box ATP-dependent RNA helicase 39-like [Gastrolobium bilobum]|uniref:DEAD-box ATP-dependent RNA helicase 39-like n=1 Tax=Gastrolobium bilobum TaxID=150636 RepID=UPI002AAFA406|nr:DEAD-box ATP-dependent RNA helicase 39-like [Gastrolobium bilobum]